MSVIFKATIKVDGIGGWFIELLDTVDNRKEVCKDLEEFQEKIEILGADYGGQVDEVQWGSDENVPPQHIQEIKALMFKYKQELDEKEKAKDLA